MKLSVFFAMCGVVLQTVCFASPVPLLEDSPENQQKRLETALGSVRAAHLTLARIQNLTHDDPDKAADLCFNAIKFLVNAEDALRTEEQSH
jgi:hypothetical protein